MSANSSVVNTFVTDAISNTVSPSTGRFRLARVAM
jgi:hypothetical protein